MSQTIITCTCCGYQIVFPADCAMKTCPACHTHNARPRSTGETLKTLQRAVEQRLACDFHNAELSYQQVLLFNPDEHEALWGRLLCSYGVEYVEDPATRRRMPTVHSVQSKPLQEQQDFIKACEFAPEEVRKQYKRDAAYIDDAQADIRDLARKCQPYDVFLCHKTTKPGSNDKTEDFHRATQLYHFLKDQGVRAFFAPVCLPHAAGANYEAGIYHALQTARVMLVICSDADYLTSAWVRSEWSRYLEWMEKEPERRLIPLLYDHFSPSSLPAAFRLRKLQGIDMTEITASAVLINAVADALDQKGWAEEEPPQPPQRNDAETAVPPESDAVSSVAEFPNYVDITFPDVRRHWRKIPKWEVCASDKKTVLTDVLWGRSVRLHAINKPSVLWVRGGKESCKTYLRWAVFFLVVFVVAGIVTGVSYEIKFMDVASVGGTIAMITAMLSLAFFIMAYCEREVISLPVSPGHHYTLKWPKSTSDNRLQVAEDQ